MVSLCLSDACSSRASRLPRRVTSLFSRVTSLRRSPRSARRDSIVAFWFSARSRVARSRRLSLSAGEAGLRLAGSILASESSFSRRVTSACRESASFAVRRTSCVSSTAAFSLLRLLSSCHFREPARARESTSAQCNSSQRASAASARARSRSARAYSRSYSERQCRGELAGAASGDDQIPVAALNQRQACCKILVANLHALDDSAWRSVLPAPLSAFITTGFMMPRVRPSRADGTFTFIHRNHVSVRRPGDFT